MQCHCLFSGGLGGDERHCEKAERSDQPLLTIGVGWVDRGRADGAGLGRAGWFIPYSSIGVGHSVSSTVTVVELWYMKWTATLCSTVLPTLAMCLCMLCAVG